MKADSPEKQKWFDHLEELRQSGETNMWGAAPYLARAFPKDFPRSRTNKQQIIDQAGAVLLEWIKAHDNPELIMKGPLSVEEETGF